MATHVKPVTNFTSVIRDGVLYLPSMCNACQDSKVENNLDRYIGTTYISYSCKSIGLSPGFNPVESFTSVIMDGALCLPLMYSVCQAGKVENK